MKAMNKNLWQAVKFTLFSISAGIIQVLSFALLHDVLGLESYWMSHVPSLVRSMLLVALFYVVFTPASAWWGTLLEQAGVHAWLIEAINLLANFVLEFLYQRFVVYRGHIDTNDVARKA